MATIYEKLPTSGEKCLILEPREALFYPFDFGSNWSEIRMGTIHSLTGPTNPNSVWSTESFITSSKPNNFYYGFTYSPDNELPTSANTIFIGTMGITGLSTNIYTDGTSQAIASLSNQQSPIFTSGSLIPVTPISNGTTLLPLQTSALSTGDALFANASFFMLKINQSTKVFTAQRCNATPANFPTNDTSTAKLRSAVSSANAISPLTGYYTDTFTSAGNLLPLPNKIVIYSPFLTSRLRIHNLIVEKYA